MVLLRDHVVNARAEQPIPRPRTAVRSSRHGLIPTSISLYLPVVGGPAVVERFVPLLQDKLQEILQLNLCNPCRAACPANYDTGPAPEMHELTGQWLVEGCLPAEA